MFPQQKNNNILAAKKKAMNKKDATLAMLQQRIKEQSCLYKISNLDEQELTVEELLMEAVSILPEGWQHSDFAAASITYGNDSYHTPLFKATPWSLSAESYIRKSTPFSIEIVYLEEPKSCNEDPFLKEERELLHSVINHISLKVEQILSQQELKEKQQLFDKAYQLANIGTWEFDMQTHELYWSPVTKEVHGFDQDYEPGLESTINLFKEGIDRKTFAQAAKDAIEKEKPFDVELKIISGQGDERWIRATGEPDYKNGVCTRFYGISQNVSDRRKAEEDLHLREQRFRSLVQDGSDLIVILDSDANFMYVSPTSESILGTPPEHYIGKNALSFMHKDDKGWVAKMFYELAPGQRIQMSPYRFKNAAGNWRWIETTLTNMTQDPAVGGLVANSRDVTEKIIQQQHNLESLKEKETLLAEIHHRVKNNLAVVSGMMQLQLSKEDNSELTDRLLDSIVRIKTMANIHEQLYQSKSFSRVDFGSNIRSLILNIQKTLQSTAEVSIDFSCQSIPLNINQAIPCSLIINEVTTNIFKHAFPNQHHGKIIVNLTESSPDSQLLLTISDNGIGLPDDFNSSDNRSLGLNLIDVLAKQLEAKYKFVSDEQGTTFTLFFAKEEVKGTGSSILE